MALEMTLSGDWVRLGVSRNSTVTSTSGCTLPVLLALETRHVILVTQIGDLHYSPVVYICRNELQHGLNRLKQEEAPVYRLGV